MQALAIGDGQAGCRAPGDRVRETDARVGVTHEPLERTGSDGLGQKLGTEVGRTDGIGVLDDRRTARLVATDRQREAEGEDETDDAQQRRLQDRERLPQARREVPLPAAEQHPDAGRAEYCCEEDESRAPRC